MGFKRRWLLACSAFLITTCCLLISKQAAAALPYGTFTKDGYGKTVYTPPAYYPIQKIGRQMPDAQPESGEPISSVLLAPQDLFIDERDHLFVADTGNHRIVEFNAAGEFVRQMTVPENPLNKPEGVFAAGNGDIYVADTGNERVVRLDAQGKLLAAFKRPVSRYIPDSYKYDPIKVVADDRGYLYIVTRGGYLGLMQLGPDGEFQRFFGANPTPFSAIDAFKRAVYTKEMYANEKSKLPPPVNNAAIDREGMIYTVTGQADSGGDQIKKLNYMGRNILLQSNKFAAANRSFGESTGMARFGDKDAVSHLVDVAVDSEGNLTTIDDGLGYVSHYDANGNLLYFWGGAASADTTQLGLIRRPVAVDVNSRGDLFVLDSDEGLVQVFRPTEFGALVLRANRLTQEGRYAESKSIWERVADIHARYPPAIMGLAQAAYDRGEFRVAAGLFVKAGSQQGYSASFWQTRIAWFRKSFSFCATVGAAVLLTLLLLNKLTRKSAWRSKWQGRLHSDKAVFVQLRHIFYLLKHPIDGFAAIRYERKGGYVFALIIAALSLCALLFSGAYTSFSFDKGVAEPFDPIETAAPYALVWSGWIICNYLISSIYRGEGRFRDTLIGSCYALLPLLIVGVPLTLLSNVLTLSEAAIYDYLNLGMKVWIGLMFFWSVQSLQNYRTGETVINLFFSMIALLVLGVLAFIVIGLTSELRAFAVEVYQEVVLR